MARRKRVAGLIVNGAVRDIDTITGWGDFPVYALGSAARGPPSKEHGPVNDIVFGGVAVRPGDIIPGDNDGIAIIRRATPGRFSSWRSKEPAWKKQGEGTRLRQAADRCLQRSKGDMSRIVSCPDHRERRLRAERYDNPIGSKMILTSYSFHGLLI
ncbi:RraA family protein [Mesorhizobium sp. B4-1-1]|nr:RraA family protein [Mesorhizobium sp. B4-1-1]